MMYFFRPLTEKIESFEKDKDHFDTRFQVILNYQIC